MADQRTKRPEHRTSVELFPYHGKWVAWCAVCGQVGLGEELEADAHAIAERHQRVAGYERARNDWRDYEW